MAQDSKFLSGITVVSLTAAIAGPSTARALAQAGAEVIKLESTLGGLDSFRYYSTADDIEASGRFLENNLNVLTAQLNLKTAEGKKLFLELIAKADVLVENFRPTVLPRLGLDLETLRKAKSDLIYIKMPGMGSTGPKNWFGTWGQTLNAVSGMTHLWNHPGREKPVGFQGAYPDYVAAALAPTAVMAALLRRRRTGHGAYLELAQAEMSAFLLGVNYLEALANGREPVAQGNVSLTAAPHDCFACAGADSWCVISVETDAQWRALCRVIGRPDLLDDTRIATEVGRLEHLSEVNAAVAEWTRTWERHAVMTSLQQVGVPAGAVQTGEDLYSDPQIRQRNLTRVVQHESLGDIPVATLPIHFSRDELHPPQAMRALGADNERVFCGILGYSAEQLAQWRDADVVK